MKLKALDQLHVSSVQADSLRPGQEFVISKAAGEDLLKAHPTKFEVIDLEDEAPPPEPGSDAKAEDAPQNKAEPDPLNKAAPKRVRAPRRKTN